MRVQAKPPQGSCSGADVRLHGSNPEASTAGHADTGRDLTAQILSSRFGVRDRRPPEPDNGSGSGPFNGSRGRVSLYAQPTAMGPRFINPDGWTLPRSQRHARIAFIVV